MLHFSLVLAGHGSYPVMNRKNVVENGIKGIYSLISWQWKASVDKRSTMLFFDADNLDIIFNVSILLFNYPSVITFKILDI